METFRDKIFGSGTWAKVLRTLSRLLRVTRCYRRNEINWPLNAGPPLRSIVLSSRDVGVVGACVNGRDGTVGGQVVVLSDQLIPFSLLQPLCSVALV